MQKFTYKITLEAENEKQAQEKITALTVMARKLTAREIKKISEVVEENGSTLKTAKNFLGL